MNFVGGLLLLIIVFTVFGNFFGNARHVNAYPVYATDRSPTGYAVTRRYYDIQTGDTYAATTPVYYVAYTNRLPRGTINYSMGTVPPMGVYPRSY